MEKYIPETLKQINNWILWKKEEVVNEKGESKTTKIPINAKTYGKAMSNNPSTWCSYDYAVKRFSKEKVDGIGFMLPEDESITMIDLDHCINNGKLNEFAENVMSRFKDTYAEISQSGEGIHIFVKGKVQKSIKNSKIEIYSKTRFCALTGNAIQSFDLQNHQNELNKLFEKYGKKVVEQSIVKSVNDLDVADILQIMRSSSNAQKFNYYFNGIAEKNSENTLGLASMLAFYCGKDRTKMKEIMNLSGLKREKFNRPTSGRTWLDYVIDTAIQGTSQVYEPSKNNYYIESNNKQKIENLEDIENVEYKENFIQISEIKEISEDQIKYIKSNFDDLDEKITGFAEDEVSVWSGLNGSGKSNFLTQQIVEYAVQGNKTMLFSGEMQDYVIKNTLIKMIAGKENLKQSTKGEYWYIPDTKKKEYILNWINKYVYLYKNSCSMDAKEIIGSIRYIVKKCGVKIAILDNLMTMNLKSYDKDKYEAQSLFAKELARLSKELHIHIHIVMHPRKAGGFLRKDDISGSADLSNAVDNVFIIHRVNTDFKNRSKDVLDSATTAVLSRFNNVIEICKNRRNGSQDEFCGLYFEKETKKFTSEYKEERKYLNWL